MFYYTNRLRNDLNRDSNIFKEMTTDPDIKTQTVLSAIVAVGKDMAIGRAGDMPWHLPEDLKHFKSITMGHPVIMGRSTWESLPRRPLPGRLNIVISRNPEYKAEGAVTVPTPEEAIRLAGAEGDPFIIGGAQIYRLMLPYCQRLYLTRIDAITPDADTFFPEITDSQWVRTESEGPMMSRNGLGYTFETYERRNNK